MQLIKNHQLNLRKAKVQTMVVGTNHLQTFQPTKEKINLWGNRKPKEETSRGQTLRNPAGRGKWRARKLRSLGDARYS